MQDRVGQQFGNYRLIRLLGRGGYAEVYLAEHIQLPNLQHAIKILTDHGLEKYQGDEFLAEARTIASLQRLSEHIVQIHDFGIQHSNDDLENGIPYLVMEYAALGTLRDLYPQGTQVPLERIVFYVNQIAEALQCAHEQDPPIIHRDIKPENMLLRTRNHILLSDFGIAIASNTGTLPYMLRDFKVAGTAAYIAPERLEGRVKRASDQYSLGVVVYEWLCGIPPFEGTNKEVCSLHLTAPPPPLHRDYPHVKPEVEAVVMRALAKKPAERYPGIQAFARALMEAAQQSASPALFFSTIASEEKAQPARVQLVGHQMIPLVTPVVRGFADVTEMNTNHLKGNERSQRSAEQVQPVEQLPPWQSFQPVPQPVPTSSRSIASSRPQAVLSPQRTAPTAFQPLATRLHDFFDFSSQFAYDPRYSFFRAIGAFLNILATFAVAFLAWKTGQVPGELLFALLWMVPAGLLYTLLLFAFCVRAIEEALAAFFGLLIAVYWGYLGWLLGETLAQYGYTANHLFASFGIGTLFFILSVILHIRYVLRKNS
jgi:serine/threonine protein kinase